jgi:glycosyltransferase involved in cell wall biosynthesis
MEIDIMKKKSSPEALYIYSGKARLNAGGLDLVVRQQIKALLDKNFKVTFISRGSYIHPNVKNITFKITPANLISFLPARYYYHAQHRFFSFVGACFLFVMNFDLAIGWSLQSLSFFKIAKKKLIPRVLNCSVSHYTQNIEFVSQPYFIWPQVNIDYLEEEYKLSNLILVASKFAQSTFLKNHLDKEKVISIGRGADFQRFSPSKTKLKKFRVVFFGRASERKGILQALDAWELASIKNGEFLIIGDIPKELKDKIYLKASKSVKIMGHLDRPEDLLKTCSVQLLPSRLEGMAKSLIEGASCGLITLSTLEAGFPILDGQTGYYIDRDNIKDIAKKIKFLYENPSKMKEMSKKSSAFVRKNYTWPVFRMRFFKAIEKSLNRLA